MDSPRKKRLAPDVRRRQIRRRTESVMHVKKLKRRSQVKDQETGGTKINWDKINTLANSQAT